MKKYHLFFIIGLILVLLLSFFYFKKEDIQEKTSLVLMKTYYGNVLLELFDAEMPETTKNFKRYISEELYKDIIFHRIINGFVIQGGGYNRLFEKLAVFEPITNEAKQALTNKKGTIAMARKSSLHSATSQFYINLTDNEHLDYRNPRSPGYAVFGKVISGMEFLEKISIVKVREEKEMHYVPVNKEVVKFTMLLGEEKNNSEK
jgi:cyclophilin family peptidyl-prolyl cis-trans isomerase